MQKENTRRNLSITLISLAATAVFSFVADWIPSGDRWLLTQIPVLLCGLLAGVRYGAVLGLLAPFFLLLLTGTPSFYPDVIAMALEFFLFGVVASPIFRSFARSAESLYAGLGAAMLAGRIGYVAAMYIMIELQHEEFALKPLLYREVLYVWPGILLQLIVIPLLTLAANSFGLLDDE